MTRVSELFITTGHQNHVLKVTSGLKTRPLLMIIVILSPLPVKLSIKKLPKKVVAWCHANSVAKFKSGQNYLDKTESGSLTIHLFEKTGYERSLKLLKIS